MILKPYMARENSLHDATYVYLTVERAVLGELSQRVQSWAMENLGPSWHSVFLSKPENSKVLGWKDPADPFYILKAFSKIMNTPLLKAVKQGPDLIELAGDVFHNRNLWAHHSQNEQMHEVKGDIRALVMFAEAAGLETAAATKEALIQLVKVTTGALPVPGKPAPVLAPAGEPQKTSRQRPRIGSAWSAELPTGEIDLNKKLQDVLDPETGDSLRSKWPTAELAKAAISRWFDLRPTTPRLRYDESDGAVVGFIEGFPYLFGYVGEEPPTPPEQYRGFLSSTTYVLIGGELVAQESGKSLSLSDSDRVLLNEVTSTRSIEDGEAFRISNYNDLVHLSDHGAVRVLSFLN